MIGGSSGKDSAPSEFGPATISVLDHNFNCLHWRSQKWTFPPIWCKNTSKKQELIIDHDTAVELPVLQHYLCLSWNIWVDEMDNSNHEFDEEMKMSLLPVLESFGARLPPRLCQQVARVQVAGDHLVVMADQYHDDVADFRLS